MATRRFYVNNAPQQTLSAQITNAATSLSVPSFSGWPSQYPFFATLELGTINEEIVSVTNIVGGTATVVRGQDGSAAISHLAGATIDFTVVRQDFDEANLHTSSSAGVHGVSGSVVGTNDVQTLTNKTLGAPVVTGTLAGASETLSGTLGVTGTSTLGVVNASGAVSATAAGTGLAVTNNATVGGTLGVTGQLNGSAAVLSGAATAASFTANANGQVTGVLNPKQYTNEAAAGTATAGLIVYLTTPTTAGYTAGLYRGNGTIWVPISPGPLVVAQLRQTVAQSIANATVVPLTWGAADYDTNAGLSAGVWTCPVTGTYRVSGAAEFAANATGRRLAKIQVAGADVSGSQHELAGLGTTGGSHSIIIPPIRVAITAGQTVALAVFQSSTAALLTIVGAPNQSYLLIEQIGATN